MTTRPVITLANSIIGVSILAMPFCFKQCGIILATIMLLLCGMLVKVTCHLLIKSALLARRKNFELLAFHTFGHLGKLCIEIGISGFLGGTAIAFFVVMGDLGPPLTANFLSIENSANLRLVILTGLGLFVALPLSMMRNIESLSVICASSIGFYLLVVLRVVLQAVPNLASGDWISQVNLWRPAGMLQCFPIFSMALSCQANVFEVYGSLKDATPGDMNDVVRGAVNLCSAIYITIGFFGYVAFCHIENLSGNILTAFPQSHMLDVVKFGFLTSVAVSFPLVIFPCRTSIHSLLFRKTYRGIESTELVTDYITPLHFNLITLAIIVFSLIIGILIPDIELVLGLVGSTMGASICVVFPAAVFLSLTTKNTTERVAAKAIFMIGIVTMILGTYVNLFEQADSSPTTSPNPSLLKPTIEPVNVLNPAKPAEIADNVLKNISDAAAKFDKKKGEPGGDTEVKESGEAPKRQEPANPVPPNETVPPASKEDKGAVKDNGTGNVKAKDKVVPVKDKESKAGVNESKKEAKPDKIISRDKKEDTEKKESTEKKADTEKEAEKLLAQLENQKKEQQKILQQQKDILNDLKIHQEKERMAEEKKAIVDAVQQYNLQGAGVMQQHIPPNPQLVPANLQQVPVNPQQVPVNPQQVPVNPQQVPVNPQQVPVNPQQVPAQANPQVPVQQQQQIVPVQQSVDNVGLPVFQQQQPIDTQQQQQQIVQQQPIVQQQQQQPIVPQQQQQPIVQQQQVNPQQMVQMGGQQQPQMIQQVPAQMNQQQQAAPVQMVPQQQQPVVQPQQPVVQQQQQYVQPQQQQFIQQAVPQVIPQQQVPVQQPQAPIVPQNVPVQQQNVQGSGVVQAQPAQVMNQAPQQPVVNQQPSYQQNEQPIAPVAINNQQQQQLPQQQQQIPQQSNDNHVETINQNPAPQHDSNVDNQQGKHVIADYDSIHKDEAGETGDKNKKQDAKVPGRDLKDDKGDEGINREKRDIICENDPDCDEKFKVDFNEKAISGMAAAGRDLLEFKSDSLN